MSGHYKRLTPCGPGGRSCGCCFPQAMKGKAAAKRQDERKARRAMNLATRKEDTHGAD